MEDQIQGGGVLKALWHTRRPFPSLFLFPLFHLYLPLSAYLFFVPFSFQAFIRPYSLR